MNVFKRSMVFVTFFGCCFSLALMAASLSTRHWFVSSCRQRKDPVPGSVSQLSTRRLTFAEGSSGNSSSFETGQSLKGTQEEEIFRPNSTGFINFGLFHGDKGLNVGFGERVFQLDVSVTDGLLSQGLWGATLAGLAGGLLFAALGAVFAVVNTATTPVEAVTGVPGLYLWNVLAAVFELLAVVCWAVQFKTRLTSNVLLVESGGGWTTEGGEGLGYSYWLVVVAVVIHLVNCAIIGFGTYEPKVKEKIQEPDKATNDILLY